MSHAAPAGALPLKELSRLTSSATGEDEVESELALQLLCFCLQTPEALAASFRRGGGSGPPDYAALAEAVVRITSFAGSGNANSSRAEAVARVAARIMESISTGLCSLRPPLPPPPPPPPPADSRSALETQEQSENDAASAMSEGNGDVPMEDLAAEAQPDCVWVAVALAAALPLLQGALPKDEQGECVLPHQHSMQVENADSMGMPVRVWNGRRAYLTNKVCDRCMESITDREYYHCSQNCDVDFCAACHSELQGVLDKFFVRKAAENSGEGAPPISHLVEGMLWAMHAADELAAQVLYRSHEERMFLAQQLAEEWPLDLFSGLVSAIVDVCNAKILFNASSGAVTSSVKRSPSGQGPYEQIACPIYDDSCFWQTLGLLQFLYASNTLRRESTLEERPVVAAHSFILGGFNKCKPEVELEHWMKSCAAESALPDLLTSKDFSTTTGAFRCLVAHSNLMPVSFRRSCLVQDIWQRIFEQRVDEMRPLVLNLEREPAALVATLEDAFSGASTCRPVEGTALSASGGQASPPSTASAAESDDAVSEAPVAGGADAVQEETRPQLTLAERLRRPLSVAFKGEAGQGPGVRKEFFHVALRAFLSTLFEEVGSRLYWFLEVDRPKAFFACGVLLAHAILHHVLIPSVFPQTLFYLLLRDLGSPLAKAAPNLAQLLPVAPEEVQSLSRVLEYQGEDIAAHFGEMGWERVDKLAGQQLTQANKHDFMTAYCEWRLGERIKDQFRPLSEGFRTVVGDSEMLREMMDAEHFECIVCGGQVPVNIPAIQSRAAHEGWTVEEETTYLESFWELLTSLAEDEKKRFLVFVTASDRVPLRGWSTMRLVVQKNGSGDDRLPTAYTCFSLLLLPRYSSVEVLKQNLLLAITNSEGFGLA